MCFVVVFIWYYDTAWACLGEILVKIDQDSLYKRSEHQRANLFTKFFSGTLGKLHLYADLFIKITRLTPCFGVLAHHDDKADLFFGGTLTWITPFHSGQQGCWGNIGATSWNRVIACWSTSWKLALHFLGTNRVDDPFLLSQSKFWFYFTNFNYILFSYI